MSQALRPAVVCSALLAALDASDGRRRQRKRDQTPDRIGLELKRRLLVRVVESDPDPADFEQWLLQYAQSAAAHEPRGAIAAMARTVLDEWRLAHSMRDFAMWLEAGAPSQDADAAGQNPAGPRS